MPTYLTKLRNFLTSARWKNIIIFICLIGICFSLILSITQLNPYKNIPLILVILLCAPSSIWQIISKSLKGNLGADFLAVIAILTAIILHEYLATVIVILMIASGQVLEVYAMRKASSALLALAERMPTLVHKKLPNGELLDAPLDKVQLGDLLVVYSHETCPVDGVVVEGRGGMDESYLTGEPYQIEKIPGSEVLSGSINGETVLTLKTLKLPSESRYAAIINVLEEAEQKRPTLRRLGDEIGAFFGPLALLIALGAWYFSNDSLRFLSVLVIATPCPLLIAIPVAIISAISIAAKQSIIIKDPTVLERLSTCTTAIFDKTGTLTYGKPTLTEILTKDLDPDFVLQHVASLERYSKHPLASALVQAAKTKNLELLEADSISEPPGKGLTGIIGNNNINITGRKKIEINYPDLVKELPESASGLECVVLINDKYAATLRFHDLPREESKLFISHLKPAHHFKKIMLVSGDRESEVKYFGNKLNVSDIYASQSPEQKIEIVKAEMQKAPTLFMGDGINDAPALTVATVGIAFGEFSNVTAGAAGAVIMENSLKKVDQLIHLSLITRRIALQSAVGGMLLSLIGMGFAAAGYINPVAGAILQEIIDVLAITNALRILWSNSIEPDHFTYIRGEK